MDERSTETHGPLSRDRVTITAVVATFNEEAYIGECLAHLLEQRGVPGEVEILVVDGMSTDRTRTIVRTFIAMGANVRLLENPRRHQAFAWNIALREMRGEHFAMITAHAEYAPDYFAQCMEAMRRTGATAVGGVPRAYGEGALGRAIAWCMSTPFGVGGARFRYIEQEEECDTVPLIFTRRETLLRAGGYDERVLFDEDSEMNYRLRASGARFLVTPRAGVRYHVRRSLRGVAKQMYRYGYYRRMTQLLHPSRVPMRIYAPPAFLAALALSAALACTPVRWLGAVTPLCYALFLSVAAVKACARIGVAGLFCIPALAVMHSAYGWGFWRGMLAMRSRLALGARAQPIRSTLS